MLRNKQIALNQAAQNGNLDEIRKLFINVKNIDVNFRNEEGYSALMFAASNGYCAAVRELISRGGDVNLGNRKGCTFSSNAKRKVN